MNLWLIGVGISIRCILYVVKLPYPEFYSIISLSPQYNATKAFEVVHQRILGVENIPHNTACHVCFVHSYLFSQIFSCGS